jgi:hypothetical protein
VARFASEAGGTSVPLGALAELVTPEQFPFLAPALTSGAFSAEGVSPFEFGFLRILDGLEAHIRERAAGRAGTTSEPDPDLAFAKDERVRNARDKVRDAEQKLRELRKKEREAVARARERARG